MDNLARKKEQDFFEELGLAVAKGPVLIGNTYPIFGMITAIDERGEGEVVVEINRNIVAKMVVPDREKLDILKKKAFETGIFVARVLAVEPRIEVDCQAVIFGRDQAFSA